MCMTKTHTKMDSHWYKHVHEENQKRIVIRTKMCMTKTHYIWIVILTEMCMTKTNKNMDSHSHIEVHDENP